MDEATDFLYPFIEGDERDAVDAARRPQSVGTGEDLREPVVPGDDARTLARHRAPAAAKVAHRLPHGGRLFTFGNGGSATDADATAALFRTPPAGTSTPRRCRSSTTRRC